MTSLSPPAIRGTLRIALKEAGLDAAQVTTAQIKVVLERVLVAMLEQRGVADAAGVCAALATKITGSGIEDDATAHDIFTRLGKPP